MLEKYFNSSTDLYHAYLIVGSDPHLIESLHSFFEQVLKVPVASNPDIWHGKYDTFSIDNARYVRVAQERKDFGGSKKFFVIEANTFTEESQNALLKIFEEPTEGTHFFIISPQDTFLPTLRSRVLVIDIAEKSAEHDSVLKLNLKERMELVKSLTDEIADEDKTRQDAIDLINQIETELYEMGVEKSFKKLKQCQSGREALFARGVSVKIILENLLLTI